MRPTELRVLVLVLSFCSLDCGDGADSLAGDATDAARGDNATVPSALHDGGPNAEPSRALDARVSSSADPTAKGDAAPRDASALPRDATTNDAAVDASRPDGSAPDAGAHAEPGCPRAGHVTYALERAASPTPAQLDAYTKIDAAMKRATQFYNCQTDITKQLRVQYEPSVQTADGNANGTIRFGAPSTFEHTRAMHEIAHTVGVGASERWSALVRDGIFTGSQATAQLRLLTGKADDQVHADTQHFWPYGLNYASEVKSDTDLVNHCLMVVALRKDLGL